MKIMTCMKFVPDPTEPAAFGPDATIVRTANGQPSQLDEYAVEQSLVLAGELDAPTVAVSVGPELAEQALRKALQMGAAEAVLVADPAIAGSDAFATAKVLAGIARTIEGVGLIVCGMSSTDGEMGVIPALLAAELGWPLLSHASQVHTDGDVLTITRLDETGSRTVTAPMPAVLSVTDQSGEPRYPSFRDVMAAKKKTVTTLALTDLGIPAAEAGAAAARLEVIQVTRNPERAAGRTITDHDGDSVAELVAYLTTEAH